jgi:flagella basal body P-ring formation protein FlgA
MIPNWILKLFFFKKSFIFFILVSSISSKELLFLKQKLITTKKDIFLSDILRLNSKVTDRKILSLGNSAKILNANEVSKLTEDEFDIRGDKIMILPLTETYSSLEIKDSLEKEFEQKKLLDLNQWRISYQGEPIQIPSEEVVVNWNLSNFQKKAGQRIIPLEVFLDKEKVLSHRLKFLFEEKKTVVYTKNSIPKNKKISEDDIILKEVFVSDSSKSLELESVIGKVAIQNIPSGTLIQKKYIKNTRLIERGSEVDIVYSKGNLFIKSKGIAKSTADSEGEMIKVQSLSNQSILQARALEKGVVVIE